MMYQLNTVAPSLTSHTSAYEVSPRSRVPTEIRWHEPPKSSEDSHTVCAHDKVMRALYVVVLYRTGEHTSRPWRSRSGFTCRAWRGIKSTAKSTAFEVHRVRNILQTNYGRYVWSTDWCTQPAPEP